MIEFTATFPLAGRAKDFAEKIGERGWWAQDIQQKGRVVTFAVKTPAPGAATSPTQLFLDYLETVGYCGSDQSRKATLTVKFEDGKTLTQRAPMAY